MAKKIDVAGQLNAATTEGIIADASQVRINDDSTVDKEVENLNANTGISEYETFSDQKAYSAGDTVLYNGLLYTFTTDHVAGAWDESQVKNTTILDNVSKLEYKDDDSDLDIADKNGVTLASFKKGHIITRKFNSNKTIKTGSDINGADLIIQDENGNAIAILINGRLITKKPSPITERTSDNNFYVQDFFGNRILKIIDGHVITKNFSSLKFSKKLDSLSENSFYVDNFKRIQYGENDDAPLNIIKENAGLASIFHRWVFIGDSYMSGEAAWLDKENTNHFTDIYEYSFGQIMCSMIGGVCKGVNFSSGGQTTTGWVSRYITRKGTGVNIDGTTAGTFYDEKAQAYLIELLINDWARTELGNFSTDINSEDSSLNASTFIGLYDRIIREIKKVQPSAKIFLLTHPGLGSSGVSLDYTNAVRQMAERYKGQNVWLVDLNKYAPNINTGGYNNGHPTPAGYYMYALLLANYIDWIIRHNINDFMYVSMIGNEDWEQNHK